MDNNMFEVEEGLGQGRGMALGGQGEVQVVVGLGVKGELEFGIRLLLNLN